ncbi:threonine-phosphate decarboxylase CobD [Colwellia sp. 20A7]|uniref:threonine-phosphate decarboxylase CobD n=1 Tax=Colwellia sp. 20A7 TaxID=2689569 RepID=UPI001357797D|nr:threonine-phosphate decarboxylase CobD [Colwellia sp. 20A7]
MALIHGGQLQRVAKQFNIAPENWLDLSTGIAPLSYPIPSIPEQLYQVLPQPNSALETAAKGYYNTNSLLITNGSQAIIKLLPTLWHEENKHSTTVYLPEQGYKEHALAWQTAGFIVCWYQDTLPEITEIKENSVLVVINPNNPTGQLYQKATLLSYQQKLAQSNGLFVIDEAFIDVIEPAQSMANISISNSDKNTLILRSFGKFFGLAGIRIGFLIGNDDWLARFSDHLGPWQVNGPAQFIAQKALEDKHWQRQQQQTLKTLSSQLQTLLTENLPMQQITTISGTALFQTVYFKAGRDDTSLENKNIDGKKSAENYYIALCKQGVYVRLTDDKCALRFGIPKAEDFERLANALANIKN